jgi:hypothetical protein
MPALCPHCGKPLPSALPEISYGAERALHLLPEHYRPGARLHVRDVAAILRISLGTTRDVLTELARLGYVRRQVLGRHNRSAYFATDRLTNPPSLKKP